VRPALIDLEYPLRHSAVRWWLCAAAALAAVLVLGAGVWRWQVVQPQLASLQQQVDAARGQGSAHGDAGGLLQTAALAAPSGDFTAALPEVPPAADVVQMLGKACADAGLVLASVQATRRAATPAQLGRTELTVVMRGPYPAARRVLDDVVQRYQALTVLRLRMRRATSPQDLETAVTLSVWSRPAADPGAALAGRAP
jgi:Type II secretion system (T2SS), protein M subtype b